MSTLQLGPVQFPVKAMPIKPAGIAAPQGGRVRHGSTGPQVNMEAVTCAQSPTMSILPAGIASAPTMQYRSCAQASRELSPGAVRQGVVAPTQASMFFSHSTSMPFSNVKQDALYETAHHDPIDRLFARHLSVLPPQHVAALAPRRLGVGRYMIDGRQLSLCWSRTAADELCVVEDEVSSIAEIPGMPVAAYLRQAINVAATMGGRTVGEPVPSVQDRHLIVDKAGSKLRMPLDDPLGVRSTTVACEQARIGETNLDKHTSQTSPPSSPKTSPRFAQTGLMLPTAALPAAIVAGGAPATLADQRRWPLAMHRPMHAG
jgi:hypothetical protein